MRSGGALDDKTLNERPRREQLESARQQLGCHISSLLFTPELLQIYKGGEGLEIAIHNRPQSLRENGGDSIVKNSSEPRLQGKKGPSSYWPFERTVSLLRI